MKFVRRLGLDAMPCYRVSSVDGPRWKPVGALGELETGQIKALRAILVLAQSCRKLHCAERPQDIEIFYPGRLNSYGTSTCRAPQRKSRPSLVILISPCAAASFALHLEKAHTRPKPIEISSLPPARSPAFLFPLRNAVLDCFARRLSRVDGLSPPCRLRQRRPTAPDGPRRGFQHLTASTKRARRRVI